MKQIIKLRQSRAGRIKQLKGQRVGRLTVLRLSSEKGNRGQLKWECLCDCGNKKTIFASCLSRKKTKSCGCLLRDKNTSKIWAEKNLSQRSEYFIWKKMLSRCQNTKDSHYEDYGGRGITVCFRWQDVRNFYKDMGQRPTSRHTIDRIDNDKGYHPENCRWATYSEQNNNRRKTVTVTYKGRTQCAEAWAKELGINGRMFRYRLRKFKNLEDVFSKKHLRGGFLKEIKG